MARHRQTGRRLPVPRAFRHAGGGHRAATGVVWSAVAALSFVLAAAAFAVVALMSFV
jgi:hypothetical protein